MEVRALLPDSGQSNFEDGEIPVERLLVNGENFRDALGGSGVWRVVDVFRSGKLLAHRFELGSQVCAVDAVAEAFAIAEQERLEFVHQYEGNETVRADDVRLDVLIDGGFHGVRSLGQRKPGRHRPAGPGRIVVFRQAVVIHHRRGNTVRVFPKVMDDVSTHTGPSANATPQSLPRVADNARGNVVEPAGQQMRRQNLTDEGFFGLPFDVDQESHGLTVGPSAELVLLPQLTQTVLLQPIFQTLRV